MCSQKPARKRTFKHELASMRSPAHARQHTLASTRSQAHAQKHTFTNILSQIHIRTNTRSYSRVHLVIFIQVRGGQASLKFPDSDGGFIIYIDHVKTVCNLGNQRL